MSASAAGGPPGPNGQRPTPPTGAPPLRKKRDTANPLVARKRPIKRPPPTAASSSSRINNLPGTAPRPGVTSRPGHGQNDPPDIEAIRKTNGGWSEPMPPSATEYPLFITKKALKEGLRFHTMRLVPPNQRFAKAGDPGIDPTNQNEFTRPVTLQRRDPRQPPPGHEVKPEEVPEPAPVDSEEAERLAQIKADREAQRAIDDAQKAPVMKDANPKKQQPNNKKQEKKTGTQVHYQARTEQQKEEAEIRYEEALPWHLEDVDGKNVWVGQYEAPLSDSKVALQIHNGGFRVVPLEKWYRFTSKRGGIQTMSIEEAEKVMGKKIPVSRWAMRDAAREESAKLLASSRERVGVKQESNTFRQASRREKMEHDDIDMSGDEFQDDDETAGFEPDRDEEAVDAKERVRREQLGANLFGDADEREVEKAEEKELKEELERKLLGKNLKKALKRRDKQFQYDSSADERDPFATSSESESEEEDEKKDEEKKGEKDKADASGTSSKGTNTPQGKKAAAETGKKGKGLKRPGSPLVSDSSGTESTRKTKKKKTGPAPSVGGSRSGTPIPGSQRGRAGAGSTSDGEATGGEMSDGAGGKKKKKGSLVVEGAKGTPSGSRAGSPALRGGASPPPPRPASPDGAAANRYINQPTGQEILDALPPAGQGIEIQKLYAVFKNRLDKPGHMPRSEWLKLINKVGYFDKAKRLTTRR